MEAGGMGCAKVVIVHRGACDLLEFTKSYCDHQQAGGRRSTLLFSGANSSRNQFRTRTQLRHSFASLSRLLMTLTLFWRLERRGEAEEWNEELLRDKIRIFFLGNILVIPVRFAHLQSSNIQGNYFTTGKAFSFYRGLEIPLTKIRTKWVFYV